MLHYKHSVLTKSWWAFRPRKKIFSPPPLPKIPNSPQTTSRPLLETPPPLLGFSIKNLPPPPSRRPRTPPSPSPTRKKISETSAKKLRFLWVHVSLQDPDLFKSRSLDSSCPFFLSDTRIWGQWTQMHQVPRQKAQIVVKTSKCWNRQGKTERENSKCYFQLGKMALTPYLRRFGYSRFFGMERISSRQMPLKPHEWPFWSGLSGPWRLQA